MSDALTIKFENELNIEVWNVLCENVGIRFAPKIHGYNSYFLADHAEIVLDVEGELIEGEPTPPSEFSGVTIRTLKEDESCIENSVKLAKKILKTFPGSVTRTSEAFAPHFEHAGIEAEEGTTMWGEKVQDSSLDTVNSVRVLNHVQDRIRDVAKQLLETNEDFTEDSIKTALSDTLDSYVGAKALQQGGVDRVKTVHVTWKDLYPNRMKRLLAQVAFRVFKMRSEYKRKPGMLLRFFGYKHRQDLYPVYDPLDKIVSVFEGDRIDFDLARDFISDLISEKGIEVLDRAELRIPYKYLAADISLVPIKPVRHIKFNVTLRDFDGNKDDLD